MPKKFYTERDIEDMYTSGTRQLQVGSDIVLTGLAFEKARQLGIQLDDALETPPSAPVRPYLSNKAAVPGTRDSSALSTDDLKESLRQRVRKAVAARLGDQVDPALLDTIINRIMKGIRI